MEQLPNIVRERLKMPAGGDHPDADVLTAFAEQSLPERERAGVLLHLTRCADCRDVLALAVPPVTAPGALDTARPHSWFEWRVLRWGAAVACVVIVGSAVLMRRDLKEAPKAVAVKEDGRAEQLVYQYAEEPASVATRAQEGTALTPEEKGNGLYKAIAPPHAKAPKPPPPAAAPVESSNTLFRSKKLAGGGLGSGVGNARPVIAGQVAQSNAVTAPAAPSAYEVDKVLAQPVQRKDEAAPARLNETVQVSAAAPPVPGETAASSDDKREALGKAKAPSGVMLNTMSSSIADTDKSSHAAQAGQKLERAKARQRTPATRWTISSDGQLQHSTDSGLTWQPVVVAEKASFRALSANGPDVWVGGATGLLYHSTDSGANWVQVKPTSGDAALTGDIAALEFTDLRQGKITTANGEAWITRDAGQTWQKQ